MKKCSACLLVLDDDMFHKRTETARGKKSHCKECIKKTAKTYNEKNKNRFSERGKQYRTSPHGRFIHARGSAKKRNILFTLNEEDYNEFLKIEDCFYCGEKLPLAGIGLDRVNSNEGYTRDNVVRCCFYCNVMKSDLSINIFFQRIAKISNNFIDKGSEESYNIKTHPIKEDKCQKNKKKTR